MNLNPLTIFRRKTKAPAPGMSGGGQMVSAAGSGGWHRLWGDRSPGQWQRAIPIGPDEALRHHCVWSCCSLIAGDLAKLPPRLMQRSDDGTYISELRGSPLSPVLRKPNNYQTIYQYLENITWSKLTHGNSYSLKVRDGRGVVVGLYPLNPYRVLPLVSTDGNVQVFYQLSTDNMAGIQDGSVVVPAREIIHDRWNTIHHPLVGMSPLYAASESAAGGLSMLRDQAHFFGHGAMPGGVLTAPGIIDPETAKRLEEKWELEYTGDNAGKVAILGSGLKWEAMKLSSVDSAVVAQMTWSATQIATCFHVPPWKLGLADLPRGYDVSSLNLEYLTSGLQVHVESLEECLTEGLGLTGDYSVQLDLTSLLRMDEASLMTFLAAGTLGGILSPNEARSRVGLGPVPGGEFPFLQQQNYSLAALAKRDALADPFAIAPPPPAKAQRTIVTKFDDNGRILEFVKVDDDDPNAPEPAAPMSPASVPAPAAVAAATVPARAAVVDTTILPGRATANSGTVLTSVSRDFMAALTSRITGKPIPIAGVATGSIAIPPVVEPTAGGADD